MKAGASDIGSFEGLIYSTSARYARILDDDLEDIQQNLRIKVWQAVRAYDGSRSSQTLEAFVFSCVTNRVKDMLKAQKRLNDRRQGRQIYTDEAAGSNPDRFEQTYLSVDDETVYCEVLDESVELPSTVTWFERSVIALLLLDLNQTEIAAVLCVTRARVRTAHAEVRVKMADWAPTSGAELVQLPQAA
jgi:RNA polymerase sigma factor (sigma-70 family)